MLSGYLDNCWWWLEAAVGHHQQPKMKSITYRKNQLNILIKNKVIPGNARRMAVLIISDATNGKT